MWELYFNTLFKKMMEDRRRKWTYQVRSLTWARCCISGLIWLICYLSHSHFLPFSLLCMRAFNAFVVLNCIYRDLTLRAKVKSIHVIAAETAAATTLVIATASSRWLFALLLRVKAACNYFFLLQKKKKKKNKNKMKNNK